MNIRVEIDKLVLYGFNYHDHRRIGAEIERELAGLIKENGLPEGKVPRHHELAKTDAGRFDLSSDMSPKLIGSKVAQSIYRSLGQYIE